MNEMRPPASAKRGEAGADQASDAAPPSVPPRHLVYAIGDIHGALELLDRLLDRIAADAKDIGADTRLLVFLGDYVDRGPDSAGVIERILSGLPEGFTSVCLKGNHEDLMLNFLGSPGELSLWIENGGGATLASYGVAVYGFDWHWGDEAGCRDDLVATMPETHIAFLRGLRLSYTIGDYFFAHAGVAPGVPLDRQRPHDLMWIRDRFLYSTENFGKIVVHGHTPVREPQMLANRIGIDTGACLTGRLTALRLFGAERLLMSTGEPN